MILCLHAAALIEAWRQDHAKGNGELNGKKGHILNIKYWHIYRLLLHNFLSHPIIFKIKNKE